ncbi:MAG TPA: sigma-70 family RNA polymerase sigma factor [Lapillicoccus sp.]|nr:sigma-70 family RNA polymerase sigma factor [Lapillicoccus sp.]
MSQLDGHTDLSVVLKAASEGDQEAWAVITDRFTKLLWAVARSYRLSHDDAGDVVQNTWLRLLENLTTIHHPEALPGWLATTARREALGILRRQGRDVLARTDDQMTDRADPQAAELDSALLEDERDAQLWASLDQLSDRCQHLLKALMAVDRPVYAEVSAAFDMPIGSIGPTRMRCLEHLRRVMAESGYTYDGPVDRPRKARG